MTRPLVLYHGPGCADGFCAAWAANRFFKGEADFLPVRYGDPVPDVAGREVYILDFSWKRQEMLQIRDQCARLAVLDHHKTAQEELACFRHGKEKDHHLPEWLSAGSREGEKELSCMVHFDMNMSGGRLAWEFFFPDQPSPWLVDYTEDKDLWRWKLPHSREISAFIASHPHDFALWDRWAGTLQGGRGSWEDFVSQGSAILRYQAQQIDNLCKNACEMVIDGHTVLAVNTPLLISEVAGKLAEGRPFGACWFVGDDGQPTFSLRSSKDGIDVSEVAKKFGGGGHRNAAGYEGVHS